MNNKYLFRFTPLGPYFFGAENRKATDNTANYFLKSFAFPQQSTMMGAIRYFMLKFICPSTVFKDNNIILKKEVPKYIGPKSFDINEQNFDFGHIKTISEVVLYYNQHVFLPLPFDKWNNEFRDTEQVAGTGIYFLPGYDVKEDYEIKFTDGSNVFYESEVFNEHIQSGNKKLNLGDDEEDGFYKQQYYRLAPDWSFALELETDLNLSNFNKPLFMPIGGENRLFKIELSEQTYESNEILKNYGHPKYFKSIVISDTFYSGNINAISWFLQTKSSRNLKSTVQETTRYRNRSLLNEKTRPINSMSANPDHIQTERLNDSMEASDLYEFIERGSTFLFSDKGSAIDFSNKIKSDYLNKAGMNKLVTLTPSNHK